MGKTEEIDDGLPDVVYTFEKTDSGAWKKVELDEFGENGTAMPNGENGPTYELRALSHKLERLIVVFVDLYGNDRLEELLECVTDDNIESFEVNIKKRAEKIIFRPEPFG